MKQPATRCWFVGLLWALAIAAGACSADEPSVNQETDSNYLSDQRDTGFFDADHSPDTSDSGSENNAPDSATTDTGANEDIGPTEDTRIIEEDIGSVDDVGTDSSPDAEDEVEPQPLGAFCDSSIPCEHDLFCHYDLNPEAQGFCTQRCDTPGTGCGYVGPDLYLKCILEDEDGPLCGFICHLDHGDHAHSYSCPSGDWGRLRCQLTSGPQGHRYCAPRD